MATLNDIFERIFVISLKNQSERRKNIMNFSKTFNFDFEFIDAVNGKLINIDKYNEEEKIAFEGNKFYCTNKCTCLGKGHEIVVGQLGCILSHHKAWEIIEDEGLDNALILEDDIYFNDNLNTQIKNIQSHIPKKWHYINMARNNKIEKKNFFNKKIVKISRGYSGTHMYGISNYGAKIALSNFYPIRANVDGYIDHFLIQKKWGSAKLNKCYATIENFGLNGSIDKKVDTNIETYY